MKIRQTSITIEGIRDDHVNRYKFAADHIRALGLKGRILDVGCGVGYGSNMMAKLDGIDVVFGIDSDRDAIDYAFEHYSSPKNAFLVSDMNDSNPSGYAAVTMFEVIEHSNKAPAFLKRAAKHVKYLFGSVPNEALLPFSRGGYNTEHYRHYTPKEIREELEVAGWRIMAIGGQKGKRGHDAEINMKHPNRRTIVFMAKSKHLTQSI